MKKDGVKGFLVLLVLLLCPVALFYSYYTWCNLAAERYNRALGTNYDAIDIMYGVQTTARDVR